jgi:hypothetical protein
MWEDYVEFGAALLAVAAIIGMHALGAMVFRCSCRVVGVEVPQFAHAFGYFFLSVVIFCFSGTFLWFRWPCSVFLMPSFRACL